jgi:hypothetical protein
MVKLKIQNNLLRMNKLIKIFLVFTVFACEEQKKKEKPIYYFLQKPTKELQEIIAKEDQLDKERLDSLKSIEYKEYENQYSSIFKLYKTHQIIELRKIFNLYSTKSLAELRKLYPTDIELVTKMWKNRIIYKSNFIIINSRISLGGGFDYLIIFKNKPDQIYQVWIYSGTTDEVRAFEKLDLNKEERKEVLNNYKRLIEDTIHSI